MAKWIVEPLSKICKTTSGGTPSRKNTEYFFNGTIPWVKSGELENNIIMDAEEYITEGAIQNSSAKVFPKGTLLIALYGATIGKLAFLGIDAATNQAVCGIFKNDKVDLKYLYYFLLFSRPNLVKQGQGGAQPNISQTILKRLMVPYPVDIGEQQRIVARIEELFSQLDDAEATLQKTKAQLVLYRQAVLKEAFQGKKQWDKYTFNDLLSEMRNGYGEKPTDSGDYKILRISAVRPLVLNPLDYRMNQDAFTEENLIQENDLLFTRYNGSQEYVGVCARVPSLDDDYAYPDKIIRCRLKQPETILAKYLMYYLNSGDARKYIRSKIKTTSGQKGIAGEDIKKTIVYIPTEKKQAAIIAYIESHLSLCDSIEHNIHECLVLSTALRQSILNECFNGGFE